MNNHLDARHRPRKRRFQFGLTCLLVAPLGVALILGGYSGRIRDGWHARMLQLNGVELRLNKRGFVEAVYLDGATNLKENNVLEETGRLDHVIHVEFNTTPLDERALRALRKFPALKSLAFVRTGISDHTMQSLSRLHGIERLDFQGEGITGNGLQHLRDLPHLMYLNLGGSDVCGNDLQPLAQCCALKYLYLNGCVRVDDRAIPYITSIKTLEVVEIISTGFTSEGGRRLGAAMPPNCFVQGVQLPPRGEAP
ncbi:MAG: hypothetical protein GY854_22055 [Deltaproteobacteria bacterium]|nr:hypothetical protein [Deltaproteobacteria bacterium]